MEREAISHRSGPGSVTPLPDIPGEKRIDSSGKVFAIQQDGVSKLYALPALQQTASITGPLSNLLRTAAGGRLLAFETNQPPDRFFIDIWNVAGQARASRIQLPAELTRLSFNSSGTELFTAQSENLQAWEIPSGKRLFSLTADSDIDAIVPILRPPPSLPSLTDASRSGMPSPARAWGSFPTQVICAPLPSAPTAVICLLGTMNALPRFGVGSADLRDQACGRLTRNLSHDEWTRWFPKQAYRQVCPNLPPAN